EITGFAVPSLFSGAGSDQALDFRKVDAPEAPVPASEVSFELSSIPVKSAEPAPEREPAADVDGAYFDLIPQESGATTPAAGQWPEPAPGQSGDISGAIETGFDL